MLWLNPNNHDTFPKGLIDALSAFSNLVVMPEQRAESIQSQLKKQMQADALQPVHPADEDDEQEDLLGRSSAAMKSSVSNEDQYSRELLEEATQFLRLQVCESSNPIRVVLVTNISIYPTYFL